MQVGSCYKEKNEHKNLTSVINNEQFGAALVSTLIKKEARYSEGSFIKRTRTSNHFDARESGDGQCSQHLCNPEKDIDNLNLKI